MSVLKKTGIVILIILLMISMYYIGVASSEKPAMQQDIKAEETVQDTGAAQAQENNESESVSHQAVKDLLLRLDYGDKVTYVIGHQSPDSDTVFSAIAMAKLLNALGIKAEPKIAGKPNGATRYLLNELSIEQPEILENAKDCQLWLVDHSTYSQAVNGASDARIVGIIDHHGIGNVETQEQIFINSARSGSTASQIWKLFKDCGVEIDRQTAAVLWCGVIDDTKYLTIDASVLDKEAAADTLKISGISDPEAKYDASRQAKNEYWGMTDEEIFYSDFKWYDADNCTFGIANISAKSIEALDDIQNRMNAVIEKVELSPNAAVVISSVYDRDYTKCYITVKSIDPEISKGLIENVFLKLEGATATGDFSVTIEPSISRKKYAPAVSEYLNSLPQTAFGTFGS